MSQGISLHIGVNEVDPTHYDGWRGPLLACEFDAEDMTALADAVGYASLTLFTQHATRDRVIHYIREAAGRLVDGDIFLLTYAGHGGQVPDTSGDERDMKDETWCLYDGQLIDDELAALYATFAAGVRILVVSDSCHSGTVSRLRSASIELPPEYVRALRGESTDYRVMPIDAARRTYRAHRDVYASLQEQAVAPATSSDIGARVRLISGCQDNQLASDGDFNGRFTGALKRVWAEGAFEGTYDDFHSAILGQMPPTQSPNHFVYGGPNLAFDQGRPFAI